MIFLKKQKKTKKQILKPRDNPGIWDIIRLGNTATFLHVQSMLFHKNKTC